MAGEGGELKFIHLRVHSSYSLLEGALPIKKIVGHATADRQPAIAVTDTNNLFGALEFSVKAAGDGLQPIIGCQLDIDMEDEATGERRGHREQFARRPSIVLLAATDAGYARLVDLVSRSYLEGTGSEPPHIRLSWLRDNGTEGLIALTGASGGPVERALAENAPDKAEARLGVLKATFGDRLYVELQRPRNYDRPRGEDDRACL
jgi:DNA polymerase III subunit alpha